MSGVSMYWVGDRERGGLVATSQGVNVPLKALFLVKIVVIKFCGPKTL